MILNKFSENLKLAMKANNITQKQLAEKLGTSQQTISRWLNRINEPDIETLVYLCYYLNETPNSLIGYEEIKKEDFEKTSLAQANLIKEALKLILQ